MGYLESLLAEREEIVFTARQHLWVLAKVALLDSTLLGACLLLGYVSPYLRLPALLPLAHLLWFGLDWRMRMFLVTNRRVMQVEGVLSKRVSDSSLEKVNDIILEQSLWGRLFQFGDLEIVTGSEEGINRLRHIAHPIEFKKAMLDQKETLREEPIQMTRADAEEIPRLIEQLDRLRQQGVLTEEEFRAKKQELLSRL